MKPDRYYAQAFHAMEVLSALELAQFTEQPADKLFVARYRLYDLENLPNQPALMQSYAIANALSALESVIKFQDCYQHSYSQLTVIKRAFGVPVFLPCGGKDVERTLYFNGAELREDRSHIQFLESSLQIFNVRPIDEGMYTCVVRDSCGIRNSSSYLRVICRYTHTQIVRSLLNFLF